MARIAGVDLPREKRVEIGLTYIYGIGRTSADRILVEAGVNPDTRCRDLTDEEVGKIRDAIDELNIAVEVISCPASVCFSVSGIRAYKLFTSSL